jgi:Ferritin-like
MSGPAEWTVGELRRHLMGAVELELTTIPPYLTALCSLHPGSNETAALAIKSVVIEEMLHLTLAANVLNAIQGRPDVTGDGYTPRYPAALPFHEPQSFEVGLLPFSDQALDVFLAIENPTHPGVEPPPSSPQATTPRVLQLAREYGYPTIGAFYAAIEEGLKVLDGRGGLFGGDPSRQVSPEYYYGSGGRVVVVESLETALAALEEIVEQGEGEVTTPPAGDKFDPEGDLAHFYRFQELRLGRQYQKEDTPGEPTGPPIEIDFDAVYPMKPNLRAAELSGELWETAESFNDLYSGLLREIQEGIDGRPEALQPAVTTMFKLRDGAEGLLRTPLPDGSGLHAGPTFEYR